MRLTIALLAYNEAPSLRTLLPDIVTHCEGSQYQDIEILVVDDNSSDETQELLRDLGEDIFNLKQVRHTVNRGYAMATRTALESSTGDVVVVMDGDGQHSPDQILRVSEPVRRGVADVVLPIRVTRSENILRRTASWVLTTQARLLLGYPERDINGGVKAFSRSSVQLLHISRTTSLVNPEIWVQSQIHNLAVHFINVDQHPRLDGSQSRAFRSPARLFVELARYMLDLRRELLK